MKKYICCFLIFTMLLSTAFSFAEAKVVNRGNPQIKEMALTFDDGYSIEKIRAIVEKLDAHDVKGTFFFVGSFIAANKEIVRELEAGGHMVVSHSFSHPKFTKLEDQAIVGEIENTKIVYTAATGKTILPYMRPPYGAYDDRVLKVLGENHDLYVIMWSIDTFDWKKIPAEEITKRVLDNAANGAIVLMHTTQHVHTDEALDAMIVGLKEQGYSLVRIDEMIDKLPEKDRLLSINADSEASAPSQEEQSTSSNTGTDPSESSEYRKPHGKHSENDRDQKSRPTKYLYRLLNNRR